MNPQQLHCVDAQAEVRSVQLPLLTDTTLALEVEASVLSVLLTSAWC